MTNKKRTASVSKARALSLDGDHNGAFTGQLLQVWNRGAYQGNYASRHAAIRAGMSPEQTPNLYMLGDVARFVAQRPFTV